MLKVERAGLMTSVQDLGRKGYRHLGVPVSGACDLSATRRVNALLENDGTDAVLECTMQGPLITFSEPTYIALSGGHMDAELDGERLEMEQVYKVNPGDELHCGHVTEGLRTYIGVKGGVQSPVLLGSRSFFYPVTAQRNLKDGDHLEYLPFESFEPKVLKMSSSRLFRKTALRVYPGPEFESLPASQQEMLFQREFTLSKDHDRMACQIQETLEPHSMRMITSATLPGTVQLTPSGHLIILMRDGQTTGGYPRILQLDQDSLDILAQKQNGDRVRFQTIS